MSKLELKIVPPLVVAVFALAMWGIAKITPQFESLGTYQKLAAAIFASAGVVLMLVSALYFKKAETTINPRRPDKSSALVTSGVYRFSRNPIYIADALILIGWGLFLSNLYSLALVAGFWLYMTRFQIKPEERVLEKLFGEEFLAYKARVRRWL